VLKEAAGEKVLQRGNQPGEELQVYHVRKLCQALQHRPCPKRLDPYVTEFERKHNLEGWGYWGILLKRLK
jgi:hypothetical protein